MGLRINSNLPALQGQRQANQASGLLSRSLEQLASQRRINRAADDAAGLAIAEGFSSQVRQSQQESSNLQSGISLAQTADGGLEIQQQAGQRLRELAIQASNGTLNDSQRAAINAEAQQLIEQVDTVAQDTQFNGQQVLSSDQEIALGTESGNSIELQASTAASTGFDTVDLSTAAGAASALETIDSGLQQIGENRANLGAQVNRFETAINQREETNVNAAEAESRIRDLDVARASIEQSRNEVLLQAGLSSIAQGNVASQSALQLLGT